LLGDKDIFEVLGTFSKDINQDKNVLPTSERSGEKPSKQPYGGQGIFFTNLSADKFRFLDTNDILHLDSDQLEHRLKELEVMEDKID